MRTSKQTRRDGKELFRCCVVNGVLDDQRVRTAVQRVLEAKPRGYTALLDHFKRLVKLDIDRRTARVESAIALPPELQARLQAGLSQRYGPGLSLTFAQNTALIGGLRIKVGCDVYDGSVQARLAALQESF
jgi:F-type H+-transporting ATPase subunit delta